MLSEKEYPNTIAVRMTHNDFKRSEALAKQFRIPKSVLIRRIFCEWLDEQPPSLVEAEAYNPEHDASPTRRTTVPPAGTGTQKESW